MIEHNLYLKGRATYLQRSSLSKLTKPKCSWLRVNTTKYLKFIAITFVFQNNAPFSKKNNKWRFSLCCNNPTNELTFFCVLNVAFFLFLFYPVFTNVLNKLKLPKRWLLIKQHEKKSSIKKWKMLYFRQMQESSLFSNNATFSMAKGSSKLCLCVSL